MLYVIKIELSKIR